MKKINLLFTAFIACMLFISGCKKEEFVVSFHPNGGRGDIVQQHFAQKTAQQLMKNTFTKNGFLFSEWNTVDDGTGAKYLDQENIIVSESMVLYAQWVAEGDTVTVTFNANGGVGKMDDQQFEAGTPKALLPNAFYKEDYTFTGWNNRPNGNGIAYENQQIVTINSNITLYAQWKPRLISYFVIFDANDGEGEMKSQEFIQNTYQKLSINEFTRDDHFFNAWNTQKDGSGISYRNREETMIHANILLYAQWVINPGDGTPCTETPTVEDASGYIYNTVQIGTQCWMRENLRTTKFQDNSDIEVVENLNDWFLLDKGAMCYYDNDIINAAFYGALYNGFAVNTGKLCPENWHVPSESEWNILAEHLGGAGNAGLKMKSVYDWSKDLYGVYGNGTNESGFNALPAGYRDVYSTNFSDIGSRTIFWSSKNDFSESEARILETNSNELRNSYFENIYGLSVRCVKDTK